MKNSERPDRIDGTSFRMTVPAFLWLGGLGAAPPVGAVLLYLVLLYGVSHWEPLLMLVLVPSLVLLPPIVLWYSRFPAMGVGPDGVFGRDVWGRLRFSSWEAAEAALPRRLFGLAMIRAPAADSASSVASVWMPRYVTDPAGLELALAVHAPSNHPLRTHWDVPEEAPPTVADRASRASAIWIVAYALHGMLYTWSALASAAPYWRRRENPVWENPAFSAVLLRLDVFETWLPLAAVVVGVVALARRANWTPPVCALINFVLTLYAVAPSVITSFTAREDWPVPTSVWVFCALATLASLVVASRSLAPPLPAAGATSPERD
ncbi:MAG: hypothetical protein MJE66_03460 [Proteobacteria bacterium]|nr:hypothetical protein [Pseudomonadota bacterium]